MLVHRLRRWTSVKPPLIQRLVSAAQSENDLIRHYVTSFVQELTTPAYRRLLNHFITFIIVLNPFY